MGRQRCSRNIPAIEDDLSTLFVRTAVRQARSHPPLPHPPVHAKSRAIGGRRRTDHGRDRSAAGKNGLTYAEAGVDIDAGNAMVEKIKPLVRSTRRPGADGEIGGFGGLFDLKAAGFVDPVLVAANDGVGTKLKIAIEAGRHDTVGIDLVAMCVNDLVVQGAEPLFFLDYFATGKLDPDQGAAIVAGIAEGCKLRRLRADRRRDGRDAGHVPRRRLRPRRLRRRRGRARPAAADRRRRRRRRAARARLVGRPLERLFAGAPDRRSSPGCLDAPAPFADGRTARRGAARADAHLCEADPQGDPRHAWRQGAGAHHRRRLPRQHPARAAEGLRRRARPLRNRRAAGLLLAGGDRRRRAER